MGWKDTVELVSIERGRDQWGDPIDQETQREVFANKLSVRQSEFWQAGLTGMRAELMFEVRVDEYEDEKLLDYAGKRYDVIRTYARNDEVMELICGRLQP